MGDKKMIIFMRYSPYENRKERKTIIMTLFSNKNDVFNKSFPFRNQNSAINKWQLGILKNICFFRYRY